MADFQEEVPQPDTPSMRAAIARLAGMNLFKCLDVQGTGKISRIVLTRALKNFDKDIFTDDVITEFLTSMGVAKQDKIDIEMLVDTVGPAPDLAGIPEDDSLPMTPSRCSTPAEGSKPRPNGASTPLDAERLLRLVQRGSSASQGSDWEQIDAEVQRRMLEVDEDASVCSDDLARLDGLTQEGAGLRAERHRLWQEHQGLLASEGFSGEGALVQA